MAFSLQQHKKKPHPKSQSFQEVQIQILQLGTYFCLALFLKTLYFLPLMIFLRTEEKPSETALCSLELLSSGLVQLCTPSPPQLCAGRRRGVPCPLPQATVLRCNHVWMTRGPQLHLTCTLDNTIVEETHFKWESRREMMAFSGEKCPSPWWGSTDLISKICKTQRKTSDSICVNSFISRALQRGKASV